MEHSGCKSLQGNQTVVLEDDQRGKARGKKTMGGSQYGMVKKREKHNACIQLSGSEWKLLVSPLNPDLSPYLTFSNLYSR